MFAKIVDNVQFQLRDILLLFEQNRELSQTNIHANAIEFFVNNPRKPFFQKIIHSSLGGIECHTIFPPIRFVLNPVQQRIEGTIFFISFVYE